MQLLLFFSLISCGSFVSSGGAAGMVPGPKVQPDLDYCQHAVLQASDDKPNICIHHHSLSAVTTWWCVNHCMKMPLLCSPVLYPIAGSWIHIPAAANGDPTAAAGPVTPNKPPRRSAITGQQEEQTRGQGGCQEVPPLQRVSLCALEVNANLTLTR